MCGDLGLGDARRRTWGHRVWDTGICGTGTRDVKYRDAAGTSNTGTRGTLMFIAKVRIKCDIYLFLLSSFFIYLESNAVILISGSRSIFLGEVSDFPEMTERTRLISYLLYGLYFMDPGLRSIKNGNWSADNLKKNTSP